MTAQIDKALRDLTTTTLRIQPVAPEPRSTEETGKLAAGVILAIPTAVALQSWLSMLAMGTLHDLFPDIPSVGFWQAVTLILGLHVVAGVLRSRPFKWARR